MGFAANFGAVPAVPDWTPGTGRGVVLSGSCSRATRGQIAAFSRDHPAKQITADAVINGAETASTLAEWVAAQDGPALVYSSADPDVVAEAQGRFGTERIAARADLLVAESVIFGEEYLFFRDAYLQRRDYLINDGEVEDAFDDF